MCIIISSELQLVTVCMGIEKNYHFNGFTGFKPVILIINTQIREVTRRMYIYAVTLN